MDIVIEGRGTFTLSLTDGNLQVSLEGNVVSKTKGNPSKPYNPPFSDLTEAEAWWRTTAHAQPVIIEEPVVEGEG